MDRALKLGLTRAVLSSTLFVAPMIAYGDLITTTVITTQSTSASTTNSWEITATGQVNTTVPGTDAVRINTSNGSLTIDANNVNTSTAVVVNSPAVFDVNITGANATVNIGSGSGISQNAPSSSQSILINATNAAINNSGTIFGKFGLISVTSNGSNATLSNNALGILNNSNSTVSTLPLITLNGPGFVLNNAGIIQNINSPNIDVIQINSPFTSINNAGQILNGGSTGTGINYTAAAGNAGSGSINNAGNIAASGTGTGILIAAKTTGNINNLGIIQSNTGSAILLNANVNQINNTGILRDNNPGNAIILAGAANVTVPGGIINSGVIRNPSGIAIDLTTQAANATLTQNDGGSIFGNVLLAAGDSAAPHAGLQNVLILNGGIITGNVNAANVNQNLLTLAGGTINGNVNLANQGDTVNLSGTTISGALLGGTNIDTYNVTGGKFTTLNGNGGQDILNINNTYTLTGTVTNVPMIKINNPGTVLTANNTISNMNTLLTINPNTTLIPNATISGSGSVLNKGLVSVTGSPTIDLSSGTGIFTNNGRVDLTSTGVLTIKGNAGVFTNAAGGVVEIDITGPANYGKMIVNSSQPNAVNLNSSSVLAPRVMGFIPQGSLFNVMTVTGGGTINPATMPALSQVSQTVFFSEAYIAGNTILQLTSDRHSFTDFSTTIVTEGIAETLDDLAAHDGFNNPTFLALLTQLDQLPTGQSIEIAMESLVPPFNYALVAGSQMLMDMIFDGVQDRLQDLHGMDNYHRHHRRNAPWGLNFGDPENAGGGWAKALAGVINQKNTANIGAYRAKGGGLAAGFDWGVNPCTTLGLAVSFTRILVDDKNINPKIESIESWQGTAYGWFELNCGFYLDAMFAVAPNDYKTNRVIGVNQINTAAQAEFDGTVLGGRADLGWNIVNPANDYYFTPFIRLKYTHLDINDYAETGAGDLSLVVSMEDVDEFLAGAGLKFGSTYYAGGILWVPEATAFLGYDIKNDGLQSFAGFSGGGDVFITDGLKPERTVFNVGLALNGNVAPCSTYSVKYNLEIRSHFVSNAAYLQYCYLWA